MELIKQNFLFGIAVCLLSYGVPCYAQLPNETDAIQSDEISSEKRIKINGYLRAGVFGGEKEIQNYYGEGALKLEVPIGLNISAFSEVRYRSDGDSNHKFDIREAYVSLSLGNFDLRAGEQIVLWGRADGFNPTNNITPQDFCVFSPEEDDKRLGNFIVKGVFSSYPFRIEMDWILVYKSSLFPFIGNPVIDGIVWNNERHIYRWKDQSLGVKIDWEKPSFDLSISYYNGLHKFPGITYENTPSEILLSQEPYRVHVIGTDFSTSLGNYGVRGEFAYSLPYKSINSIYSIPNKQIEYTIGIDKNWDNFSLIVQYIGKYIPDLNTSIKGNSVEWKLNLLNRIIFSQHKRWNHSASVRPSLSLLHETLNLELLGLCRFSTKEYFFQPKVRYAVADAVTLVLGGAIILRSRKPLVRYFGKDKKCSFYGIESFVLDYNLKIISNEKIS